MLFDFRCQTSVQIFPFKETHNGRTEKISTEGTKKICLKKTALILILSPSLGDLIVVDMELASS